jgi:hypothetical protein
MNLEGRDLRPGLTGQDVTNLHDALAAAGETVLAPERESRTFGPGTQKAVESFQRSQQMPLTGIVDPATAEKLTQAGIARGPIGDGGLRAAEPPAPIEPIAQRPPAPAPPVSPPVLPAPTPVTGTTGAAPHGDGAGGAVASRPVDESLPPVHSELPPHLREYFGGPPPPASDATYTVSGVVADPERGGVGGYLVSVFDRNVSGDAFLGRAITDQYGSYTVTFTVADFKSRGTGKEAPDLQTRVLTGESQVLATSEVRYYASLMEILDVVLPAAMSGVQSEHDALMAAVSSEFKGDLATLKEEGEHADISYLANKTGWDARAIAMSSLAHGLAQPTGAGEAMGAGSAQLLPEHFYALMRAGVPASAEGLYSVDAQTAAGVWRDAAAKGIVPAAIGEHADEAAKRFQEVSGQHYALGFAALPGAATLGELVKPALGEDPKKQQQFASILVANREQPRELWKEASAAFDEPTVKRLRVDGQLALLTLDNAPLIAAVHHAQGQTPLNSVADLVPAGYHRPETWEHLVKGMVPAQIPGQNEAERERNYAEVLAAQLRLSFPTAVLADRIGRGELQLGDESSRQAVKQFLIEQAESFHVGLEPLDGYIKRRNLAVADPVRGEVLRLQRVYQLTTDDTAMQGLLANGLDSAWHIVRYGREEFASRFGAHLGGEEAAHAISRRAGQITLALLSIASSYLTTRTAPVIGDGAPFVDPSAQLGAVTKQAQQPGFPTLETLFGSMDFCACEQCRSVLSPAAYLVDLLLFADRTPTAGENPQAVLFERRPDLQHLPLTCENTNTPVPYIDIVNEVLEHLVVNNMTLGGYEGHDTGQRVGPEDLLAAPQFVSDQAYEKLKEERFPPPLPFHRPLELLRRHFDALQTPLQDAMAALRADDLVDRTQTDGYAWRDVLMERLKLSRQEHQLLTDSTLTPAELYGFPASTTEAQVLEDLTPAKAFAQRVGLQYTELLALLKTTFVNPAAFLIPRMQRLGLRFAQLSEVKAGTLTDAALAPILPPGVQPSDVHAFISAHYEAASHLILLHENAGATDPCALASFSLRHTDGSPLVAIELIRLARFVRLWRKLGWTAGQVDDAIGALYPPDKRPAGGSPGEEMRVLDEGCKTLLARLGVVVGAMERLGARPKQDLAEALTCWGPMPAAGESSLYAQLFLGPSFLVRDPAFGVDEDGHVLEAANQKIGEHREALRAATGMTAEELALVESRLAGGEEAPLTLANVSFLYRHAWLARQLRLSVREFVLLIAHTGIDPFAAPDPPAPPIIALLDLLDLLRSIGLKPSQALYIVFDDDIAGNSDPAEGDIRALARTLRTGFAEVEADFAVKDDPTGEIARARMELVYGHEAAETLFAQLDESFTVSVSPKPALEPLPSAVLSTVLSTGHGRLNPDIQRNRLTYAGVLDQATANALKAVPGVGSVFSSAVDLLLAETKTQTEAFYARFPELLPIYQAYVTSTAPLAHRREKVLEEFLPHLIRDRKRQQALATIAAVLHVDPQLIQPLATSAAAITATSETGAPALDDLLGVEKPGLSTVHHGPEGPPGPHGGPSGGPVSSPSWQGLLEAPLSAEFMLAVDTDAADVHLSLDGREIALTKTANRWRSTEPITLQAGQLVEVHLTVDGMTPSVSLLWETAGQGWETIPGRRLYSAVTIDHMRSTYIRLLKAASLATAAGLTGAEMTYLATDPDLQIAGQGWLNAIPVTGFAPHRVEQELLAALRGLATYARLKAKFAPSDERLLEALRNPAAVAADGTSPLPTVTGWASDSLEALLAHTGKKRADLTHLDLFARIDAAYAVVSALGTSAAAAIAATTNEPQAAQVAAFQAAVRARYQPSDWLAILRPINDTLRALQRDALVAYVLRRFSESKGIAQIDSADRLFEYLLMDVEMEPCQQTSRIRHAISSVQLFLERCQMNLEETVSAAVIDSNQWEWMKRYRVWEANRKVFLWPENWLEPELREDQSPFFKEAMGQLLQGDITDDAATEVLLGYLTKLEEVARLEPAGLYVERDAPPGTDPTVHVLARTSGAHRKYYYRRSEQGSWSAWEQVKLDIEDNPIMPVVWRGRLFLMWLRLVKQSATNPAQLPTTSGYSGKGLTALTLGEAKSDAKEGGEKTTKVNVKAILSYSEYVNGVWQPVKTSDSAVPTDLGPFTSAGEAAFDRLQLVLSTSDESGELEVHISGQGNGQGRFRLYSTHSAPVPNEQLPPGEDTLEVVARQINSTGGALSALYLDDLTQYEPRMERAILGGGGLPITIVQPRQTLDEEAWDAPFIVADPRGAFFVETTQKLLSISSEYFGLITLQWGGGLYTVPPVRWQPGRPIGPRPDPWIGVMRPPRPIIVPAPIAQGLGQGGNIQRTVYSHLPITLGRTPIGPAGAINRTPVREHEQ